MGNETRRKTGGARPGAGRKPKADEIKLIETMDAISAPAKVWQKLFDKVQEGDTNAIKTWLQYRFGMPKQKIEAEVEASIEISFED